MGTNLTGLLEMSLVFGSILALAIYELFSLRREKRRDAAKRRAAEPDDSI